MVWTTILFFLIGLIQSYLAKDFTWLQRIGSFIVGIGIILLSRPSIVRQPLLLPVKMADSDYHSNEPDHYKAVNEPVPEVVKVDVKNRVAVNILGPIITFGGTILW